MKPMRSGVSLLEVLVSIGVVAIGLLGVSALIPVAGHQAEEGIRNERMTSFGKRVFRDLRVRGFLERKNWSQLTVGMSPAQAATETVPLSGATGYYQPVSYCVDPLLPTLAGETSPSQYPTFLSGTQNIVAWMGQSAAWGTHLDHMKELGVSQDELKFDITGKSRTPPVNQTLTSSNGNPLKRYASGKYSWMALIVPENRTASRSDKYDGRYVVSLAIFEDRAKGGTEYLQLPALSFDGIAGGTMVLDDLDNISPGIRTDRKAFRVGTWVLVAGKKSLTTPVSHEVVDYQWYRILSVDFDNNGNPKHLTLDGPDWRMDTTSSQVSLMVPFQRANPQSGTILPWHVASVYTKTMRLGGP